MINLSNPIACWLLDSSYTKDINSNSKTISATSILKSPRNIIFQQRLDYPNEFPEELIDEVNKFTVPSFNIEEDCFSRVPMRIGSAIHSAIEHTITNPDKLKQYLKHIGLISDNIEIITDISDFKDSYSRSKYYLFSEQRNSKTLDNGFTITGQFDFVENGQLHDIKTTKTYSYEKEHLYKKYMIQGSIYRWLFPDIITRDTMIVDMVFTNFMKQSTTVDGPKLPIVQVELQLMDVCMVEDLLLNQTNILKEYWDKSLFEIPCCSDEMLYPNPPEYKYYKTGYEEGKRATRKFSTIYEAEDFKRNNGNVGDIVEFKGTPYYCPCCNLSLNF